MRKNHSAFWVVGFFVVLGAVLALTAYAAPPYAYIPSERNSTASALRVCQAVCNIQAPRWSGSGALVATRGNKALVLSCRHVCTRVGLPVTVNWPLSNQSSRGTVVEVVNGNQFDNDLALVVCDRPVGVAPLRVKPFCGTCGPWFGLGWRANLFRLAIADSAAEYGTGRIELNSPYVGGMSGGPLVDSRGALVGVVVGSDDPDGRGFGILGIAADGPWLRAMLQKYGK